MHLISLLSGLGLLVGGAVGAATPNRPCQNHPKAVSKLKQCATAASFCSSYLQLNQPNSHPFTKTIVTTTTLSDAPAKVTTTASVTVTPTVTLSTADGCPNSQLKGRATLAKTNSCGFGSKTQSKTISGACSCLLATSTTTTATTTVTTGVADTVTVTSTASAAAVTLYNYLENGGFEDDASSFQPWAPARMSAPGSDILPQLVSPGAYGNSSTALELRIPNSGNFLSSYVSQHRHVCPGQDFLFTFSYNIDSNSDSSILVTSLYNDQGDNVGHYTNRYLIYSFAGQPKDATGASVGSWQTVSYVLNSGKETSVWPTIQLSLQGSSGSSTVHIDDVFMVPINYKSLPTNGDFETGSLFPWSPFTTNPANIGHVNIASPGRNSDFAMLLISPDPGIYSIVEAFTTFGSIANTAYQLSFSYFRFPNATGITSMTLIVRNVDSDSPDRYDITFTDQDDDDHGGSVGSWNRVSFPFVAIDGSYTGASESVTSIILILRNGDTSGIGTNNDGVSIAIDDISWDVDGV